MWCVLDPAVQFAPAASQKGFWPLNNQYRGRNLVPGNADFQLSGINLNSEAPQWLEAPIHFTGDQDSYAEIVNDDSIAVTRSFSWIGAINMYAR